MFSEAFFTGIQGGKLFVGFAAGSLSSVMSSLWQGGEHFKDNGDFTMSREMVNGIGGANLGTVGTMFFGTISGGAGAAISGGNFWQGAVTGLVVSGMNHIMHQTHANKLMSKRFNKINPKSKVSYTNDHINSVINDVDGLSSAQLESKNGNIRWTQLAGDYGQYDSAANEIALSTTHIKNNLQLASTLFHEFRHAWQWNSGFIMQWASNRGIPFFPKSGIIVNFQEWDARNFQVIMGDTNPTMLFERAEYRQKVNKYMINNNINYKIVH